MKYWTTTAATIFVIAGCGADTGGEQGTSGQAIDGQAVSTQAVDGRGAGLRPALERVLASDAEGRGPVACDVLRSGVLSEVFGADADAAVFEPAGRFVSQALCTAAWDKPDREALEAARIEYESRRGMARIQGRAFDEPLPPYPRYEVSLTIINHGYDSAADAVTDLEGVVAGLTHGGTMQPPGGDPAELMFEGFIDGVGDQAAWAPRLGELSAAHAGVRYAVVVRGFTGPAENKEKAIEFAQRLAGGG